MKLVVFTAGGIWHRPQELRVRWAATLRERARFGGAAVMLDFGLPAGVRRALALHDVECLDMPRRLPGERIKSASFLVAAELLASRFRDAVAAFYDSDVRFEQPLDILFDRAADAPRCVLAPDLFGYRQAWLGCEGSREARVQGRPSGILPLQGRGSGDVGRAAGRRWGQGSGSRCEAMLSDRVHAALNQETSTAYHRKCDALVERFGATINSGMIAGRAAVLAEFLHHAHALCRRMRLPRGHRHAVDQFAVNLLVDPSRDDCTAHAFNVIHLEARCDNGAWHSTRPGCAGQMACAIHETGRRE